ncbi:MAG: hypothetical protein AB7I48_21245 [Planctomycetaceae bacterium]
MIRRQNRYTDTGPGIELKSGDRAAVAGSQVADGDLVGILVDELDAAGGEQEEGWSVSSVCI